MSADQGKREAIGEAIDLLVSHGYCVVSVAGLDRFFGLSAAPVSDQPCLNPNCNQGHEMVPDDRGEPADGGRCRYFCDGGLVSRPTTSIEEAAF